MFKMKLHILKAFFLWVMVITIKLWVEVRFISPMPYCHIVFSYKKNKKPKKQSKSKIDNRQKENDDNTKHE